MSTANSRSCRRFAVAALLAVSAAWAAGPADAGKWLAVQFPHDSPVVSVSFDYGPSTATVRGASTIIDLHAGLVLRNVGTKPVSGLSLRVEAQDLSPHGKGSVMKPSLFILPGEEVPVKIELQLARPIAAGRSEGAMLQITLDCALFSDLTAYGPDKLNLRHTLMVYEMEARRDRQYLAHLLDTGRIPELREELNYGIRDAMPRQLGLELLRGSHSSGGREHTLAVNPVNFPKGPVQPLSGAAQVAGNEVRSPRVDIRNVSKQQIASVAMGWIVSDDRGMNFVAGALTSRLPVASLETSFVTESGTLRFLLPSGQPLIIGRLMTFVNDVEFADGSLWIPSREDINAATQEDAALRRELATSPEEQRLAAIYSREGTEGLKREFKRLGLSH